MAPRKFADMQPRERRRALVEVVGRVGLTWILLIGAYFLIPVGRDSEASAIVKLLIILVVVVAVILWQLRRIVHAEVPELRATEALGVILIVFLLLFASLYLSISHTSASAFTQSLDHMSALYFTVTVFSTVGFGDITAKTDGGRALVTLQMILDLVIIGAVARLLITAARTGLTRPSGQT